jgi:hypothetical protein
MFPTEFADCDAAETLARVEAAHAQQRRSELDLILLAQHYAYLHPVPTHGRGLPGGERARVYGGEGCPEVAEFAPAEFGAITGVSPGSAARFIGQCVALPFRFPNTWDRVKTGRATPWKARQIAQDCVNLSLEAAAIVDRRVADAIDTVTGQQLANIKKTAIWEADPDAAKAKAEAEAKERGVWVGRTDDHGTTRLFVKAATGDVIALDATISQLAAALAATGDTDSLDQRRAKAAGLLSDPELAADLLAAAQHLAATTESTSTEDNLAEDNQVGRADLGSHDDSDSLRDRDTAASAARPADNVPAPDTTPEPTTSATTRSADKAYQTDLGDRARLDEPGLGDEADRETPHPNTPDHPLDQDQPLPVPPDPGDPERDSAGTGEPPGERLSILRPTLGIGDPPEPVDDPARTGMDAAARLELRRKIDAVRRDHPDLRGRRIYQTMLNIHITDETLFTGAGTARIEGYGAVYTNRLEELLGHHRIVVRPVNNLHTPISVHSYEIPEHLRDQVNLRYPIEQFPYGTGETRTTPNPGSEERAATDLDHINPFRPEDPTPQTRTDNLAPQRRFSHRLKTHADWEVRRINPYTLEWTSPHGYTFHVDHNGTHRIPNRNSRRRHKPKPPPPQSPAPDLGA